MYTTSSDCCNFNLSSGLRGAQLEGGHHRWLPGMFSIHYQVLLYNLKCYLKVGLHANSSEDTRLLYCTTGVLLQQLIKNKTLSPYTHIILDEVHEREQDMDFLLIIIRRLLVTNSKHVKIILMSATIDTSMVSNIIFINT